MTEAESFIMADAQRCTVHPQHVMVNQGRREWLYADLFECECGRRVIGNTDELKARALAVNCVILDLTRPEVTP